MIAQQMAAKSIHTITVLIVDDHAEVRQRLRSFLELQDGMEIVGEADNGQAAVEQVRQLSPKIVVMDLMMPCMDGIEATRRVRELNPSTRVIVLTSYGDESNLQRATEAGAGICLQKGSSPTELVKAIRALHPGPAAEP